MVADNKAIYREYIQRVFNEGRVELLDDYLAPAYAVQEGAPGTPPGAEGVRQAVAMFRDAFPDLNITLEEVIGEGDTVAARSTVRGTHRGGIMGIPPTGKQVSVGSLTMIHMENGKLTASWVKTDIGELMRQLGEG